MSTSDKNIHLELPPEFDELDFSDEEIAEMVEEIEEDFESWSINFADVIEHLCDESKRFLSELSDKMGDTIFYMIYGYLNADNLIEYDEMTNGGVSGFIAKLDNTETLRFIELFVDIEKQEIGFSETKTDIKKVIAKLKRDVAILKNKLIKPSEYITTKQFEEMFGLTSVQQKGLRSKIHDPLPYTVTNGKTILYNEIEVSKWFENYKRK